MPRLSALPLGSGEVGTVVDQQLRFVMLVGGPLIAVGILVPGFLFARHSRARSRAATCC